MSLQQLLFDLATDEAIEALLCFEIALDQLNATFAKAGLTALEGCLN